MKCSEFRKLLMPYADGSLPEEMSDSMERHLAECESCARELRSLACTVGVLKEIEYPAMEPATDLRSRVLAQISPEPARRSWWQAARLQAYSAAAAGLLLIAIAGAGMWSMLERGMEVTPTQEVTQEQKVDRVQPPSSVAAPSEMVKALPGVQPGAAPRKPNAKKIEEGPARRAWPLTPPASSPSDTDEYRVDAIHPLYGEWYDRGLSASSGTLEGAPDGSAGLPKALGYGVTPEGTEMPAGPARQPSQELASSMKQSDLGGTQSFMYRGGPEGVSGARPAPSTANGAVASPPTVGEMLAENPANGTSFELSDKPFSRMAAGNTAYFDNVSLGLDIRALETKLRDFPSSVTVITDLMAKYREAGRPRDEYQMAQRLTKLDPDNSGYWLSRAQAADRVPMPATARVCYERAIKLGLKGEALGQAQERVKALGEK